MSGPALCVAGPAVLESDVRSPDPMPRNGHVQACAGARLVDIQRVTQPCPPFREVGKVSLIVNTQVIVLQPHSPAAERLSPPLLRHGMDETDRQAGGDGKELSAAGKSNKPEPLKEREGD